MLGYVKKGTLAEAETVTVRVLGNDCTAIRHNPHIYDRDNARMKC